MIVRILCILLIVLFSVTASAECKKYGRLYRAKHYASELAKSYQWVSANWQLNIWSNPSPKRFPILGKARPGDTLEIIGETTNEYKVLHGGNRSGYIGKVQIETVYTKDSKTGAVCS